MAKITNLGESQKSDNGNKQVFSVKLRIGKRTIEKISREIDKRQNLLIHYPFWMDEKECVIKDKYNTIKKIVFEDHKKRPTGFYKVAGRGYGFTKTLSSLKYFIEKTFPTVNTIRISNNNSQIEGTTLVMNFNDVSGLSAKLAENLDIFKKNNDNALKIFFNTKLGQELAVESNEYTAGDLSTFLQGVQNPVFSQDDVNAVLGVIENIEITEKSTIVKTRKIIEKKQLESVLEDFEKLLIKTSIKEDKRQRFFENNPRIFSQIFGFSAVMFKSQAYVGGKSISNQGGNVTDFLYRNKFSDNIAIVEIKTHSSDIFLAGAYRGTDIFANSKDLSGAINQVLDQKYSLTTEYNSLVANSPEKFKVLNPKCFIIIGKYESLSEQQKKCFELFRNTNKDIELITFDELFDKIKSILDLFEAQ